MTAAAKAKVEFVTVDPRATIEELQRHVRAMPGVNYCFVLAKNELLAAECSVREWRRVADAPYFKIAGQHCVLMWSGEPRPGASGESASANVMLDPELHAMVYPKPTAAKPPQKG